MIARLRGTVAEIGDDTLVVDVAGVGYLVQASPRLLRALPAAGGTVELVIEMLVREDAITLVGFTTPRERGLFKLLQGIQGVGSRLALSLIGTLEPEAFERAIVAGDRAALTAAPGVGPRLAQRILTELKDRMGAALAAPTMASGVARAAAGPSEDAVTALAQLGYGRSEALVAAQNAIAELGDGAELAAILRRALQLLGTQRG